MEDVPLVLRKSIIMVSARWDSYTAGPVTTWLNNEYLNDGLGAGVQFHD